MATVEIIATGNELLLGDVLDTNTNWLCKQISGLGGQVQRATMLGDDRPVIAAEVRAALARQPRIIFTVGGLGPTADDMTLAAVADAVERPLEMNQEALALVRATFHNLAQKGYVDDPSLTPAREKMAILPRGAVPLVNSAGAAPGVLLHIGQSAIVSLPGVPPELVAIFEESLQSLLADIFGRRAFRESMVIAACKDESILAPLLEGVAQRHPHVYIKSRAKAYGADDQFRITLSCAGEGTELVEQCMAEALADLRAVLNRAQIRLETQREH